MMRKTFYTIILFLVSLVPIRSGYAESGPPSFQEVEATGQGATEDDAFKQAVVDAVRQVVGTLVSAENVIKNDRVIKDEVLTLSNGFVEKVSKQNKRKLADGIWEVKLECTVRKGQVYGKLQEAKVPTVKVDGVSLFADVVSQLEVQKDSGELLSKAFEEFSTYLVTAKVLNPKPRILRRDEKETRIELNCQAVCDLDRFFSQVAPKLEQALDKTCIGKPKELTDSSSKTERLDLSGQKLLTFAPIKGVLGNNGMDPGLFRAGIGRREDQYIACLPIKGGRDQRKWSYKIYELDKRVFAAWPRCVKGGFLRNDTKVFAIFLDTKGQLLGMMNVGEFAFGGVERCDISLLPLIKERGRFVPIYEWQAEVDIPTAALPDIAAIKLVVGRSVLYDVLKRRAILRPESCYCMVLNSFTWNRICALKLNKGDLFELVCPSPSSLTPETLGKAEYAVRRIEPRQLNAGDWPYGLELMP